jgi:hypothetical protein
MMRASTRMIAFPDGLTRAITLQNRYWRVYDIQTRDNPAWIEKFPRLAYTQAKSRMTEEEDFETLLRLCFRIHMRARLEMRSEHEYGIANVNRPDEP